MLIQLQPLCVFKPQCKSGLFLRTFFQRAVDIDIDCGIPACRTIGGAKSKDLSTDIPHWKFRIVVVAFIHTHRPGSLSSLQAYTAGFAISSYDLLVPEAQSKFWIKSARPVKCAVDRNYAPNPGFCLKNLHQYILCRACP